MLAIIGGSGLSQLANFEITRRQVIRTPYGEPSGALTFGKIKNHEVVFLARHGYGHTLAPHEINYRANMWALQAQGVVDVVSIASVGGISEEHGPGSIFIPDQIIDYTHGRKATYFEGSEAPVTHVDFTDPYCEKMRQRCMKATLVSGETYVDGGVYAAVQGPRLESRAEIDKFERDGANLVGMTGMPEASLARELDLCYAAIAVVVNYAAGRGSSGNGIQFNELSDVIDKSMSRVRLILEHLVEINDD
ncbi:MAG: S-methyl-5'-thioinosine phosphorylase [Burkholderiales bacterium]